MVTKMTHSELIGENENLYCDIARRDAAIRLLRDALQAVEWIDIVDEDGDLFTQCPWCGGQAPTGNEFMDVGFMLGHKLDCQRRVALENLPK